MTDSQGPQSAAPAGVPPSFIIRLLATSLGSPFRSGAGREVRGALDPGQGSFGWAATRWLHEAGVELFLPRREAPFRKLHHKLMVIDDSIVVAGSFNYTGPANDYNDENIFVLGSPYEELPQREGGPTNLDECAALTGFFRDEIDRIITELSDPYAPT